LSARTRLRWRTSVSCLCWLEILGLVVSWKSIKFSNNPMYLMFVIQNLFSLFLEIILLALINVQLKQVSFFWFNLNTYVGNKCIVMIDSITNSVCLCYYVQNGLSYSGKGTRHIYNSNPIFGAFSECKWREI